jgi:hypothetical protein
VAAPLSDDALGLLQAVEDLSVQQLVTQLCYDIPASRHAIGADLPCDIKTSIWRSKITICSALKRFFGITSFLSKPVSIKPLGKKRPGQVTTIRYVRSCAGFLRPGEEARD